MEKCVTLPQLSQVVVTIPLLLLLATLVATLVLIVLTGPKLTLTISERIFFDEVFDFVVSDERHDLR